VWNIDNPFGYEVEVDYYAYLGLQPAASLDEVRRAVRKLLNIYHQDRAGTVPEARTRYERILEAKKVLEDPKLKEQYDDARAARLGAMIREEDIVDVPPEEAQPDLSLLQLETTIIRLVREKKWVSLAIIADSSEFCSGSRAEADRQEAICWGPEEGNYNR
jgi:curved DNA-binding protein CbpA